jgi:hypothetical protein
MQERDGAGRNAQSWRQLYDAALLEVQRDKLLDRITEAQKAMGQRALVLTRESDSEKYALEDAQAVMGVLKRSHQAEQRNSAGRVA